MIAKVPSTSLASANADNVIITTTCAACPKNISIEDCGISSNVAEVVVAANIVPGTCTLLDGISHVPPPPSPNPSPTITDGAVVNVPALTACCPFKVYVPATNSDTVLDTIETDPTSPPVPCILSLSACSPLISINRSTVLLLPIAEVVADIIPNISAVTGVVMDCVNPSMSSGVADVVVSLATVS